MDIPSDPCQTPEFRRKLKARANAILRQLFDPTSRGMDRDAFIDDLIGEAEKRIACRDKPIVVRSWLAFYNEFMLNIVREERRKASRNPLAGSRGLDDPKTFEDLIVLPGHDKALAIHNRVTVLLDSFCRENAGRMRGEGLDPGTFPKLWLRRHLEGFTIREVAQEPHTPTKSTLARWEQDFQRYAREHWNDAPPARQEPQRKQR